MTFLLDRDHAWVVWFCPIYLREIQWWWCIIQIFANHILTCSYLQSFNQAVVQAIVRNGVIILKLNPKSCLTTVELNWIKTESWDSLKYRQMELGCSILKRGISTSRTEQVEKSHIWFVTYTHSKPAAAL